ncbi:helix-turn-helix domain-containing protein [Puniceicoccaceae bacterium K14]|nr:helix-turn-helix domain-containing protein [Puniceicoccaceae bacterium K14]
MEKKNITGPQVRKIRVSKQLSQEEFTAKCNLIGWDISRGTLAKIESQVRRITDDEVALIAKALKVRIQDLYEK